MKVSCVNEMRNLDHQTIEKYGIAKEILMENADQASYFTIKILKFMLLPEVRKTRMQLRNSVQLELVIMKIKSRRS